ncbi:energy-coupling factor transporter transmembrane component T family protein [Syntrophomonas wolfei]|jgi:energy-coupling factor transport system permease protein|uniref:Cobalt transport protein n=1 Tax=Syntrophomonas wolfei subsp. wolfei (strain DSM 2245B / Goettingen) TaxID=335541 RepID=Q0AY47_SYNWW|nr:energy-coupling factor transporter transmembrane component T [Syntrophomonas wolfei]ABI68357.1 cobalt transport protein [Syntrophomonas wolfei subsp. wolfei str. Goettingen G311]
MNDTMLTYQVKDNLIHSLHPLTTLSYVSVITILSLIFYHPLYLAALLLPAALVIVSSGHYKEWSIYLKLSVSLIILIVVLNMLFSREGETVLFSLQLYSGMAPINLSLEALGFAAGMGLRLLVIITAFCLYSQAIDPDRMLRAVAGLGKGKTALAIILSTRLLPQFLRDFRRIMEISQCRGVDPYKGNLWQRTCRLKPVISVLFSSSLEQALELAESMYARGYGSGARSQRQADLWRPRDFLILLALIIAFFCGIRAYGQGWSNFAYYPHLNWEFSGSGILTLMTLSLAIPSVLNWGCKRSNSFLSKI